MNPSLLARLIDHTCLKPTADRAEIRTLCAEATRYRFRTVCVPPAHVAFALSCWRVCRWMSARSLASGL